MANQRLLGILLAGTTIVGLAACGGGKTSATSGSFNDQSNRAVSCMTHQTASPAAADHPGTAEDPSRVLTYLHYYTANGNKPYCDGNPPTAIDRQWLDLYVAGGADRSHVTRALAGS
jgi:hypothetical protein